MESQELTAFFYNLTLSLHNISRWLVLGFGVWSVVRAFRGWFGKHAWTTTDDRAALAFVSVIDLQLLLGLLLYFVFSPYTAIAFQNFSAAMSQKMVRFFALEHLLMMVIALVIAHVSRVFVKKAQTAIAKHRKTAIWFTLTLVIILASIPWPFLGLGRPWFRLFGIAF